MSTCGYAITFFLRFYSRKSMKRNNTFVRREVLMAAAAPGASHAHVASTPLASSQVIAAACLFLASKVNDEPKPHRHLTVELFKCWYGRRHPRLQDTDAGRFLAELYDLVIRAEEAGARRRGLHRAGNVQQLGRAVSAHRRCWLPYPAFPLRSSPAPSPPASPLHHWL